jgi:hypothetical protein
MLREKGGEFFRIFRSNNQYGDLSLGKFIDILAQLRHVLAAEWSGEATVKDEHDRLLALEMGQAHHIALIILQNEVWRLSI